MTDAVPALRGGGAAARAVVVVKGHKGHSLLAIAVRCLADIGAAAGLDLLGARYVYVPAAGLDAPGRPNKGGWLHCDVTSVTERTHSSYEEAST